MKRKSQFLIFTDLDGTFLDHRDYSPEPARSFVRDLDSDRFVLVPVTSKTRSETQDFVDDLGLNCIFATENGSAIHAPTGFPWTESTGAESHLMGKSHAEIMRRLDDLPKELRRHVRGFSDMNSRQVAESTGLSLADAKKAREREGSEPFSWSGSMAELKQLREIMSEYGIALQQGGRYYHLTGECGKIDAVRWICENYKGAFPDQQFIILALGDGPNDLAMIEYADHGVIIPNADGNAIQSQEDNVCVARKTGPEGWVMAVSEILSSLERS